MSAIPASSYLTVDQAAALAHCEHRTIRRAIARGDVAAIRGCCSWFVTPRALGEWLRLNGMLQLEGVPIPEPEYVAILRADPCCYCGAPTEHVDHIEPRSSGGLNVWTNITAACARCNQSKHDKSLLRFLLRRGQ